jgi:type II restriction/modification system DNA methylase subunit YeeA
MVGFDGGTEKFRLLNGQSVKTINSDLTSSADVTNAKRLHENSGVSFEGTKKYGPFDIEEHVAQELLRDRGNPNKRPNSDVIKPWVNGSDITGQSRNMWIIDFGVDMPLEEASMYEKPFEYVLQHIKPIRTKVSDKKTRENWWLFQRPRPAMREALVGLYRYIVTPRVGHWVRAV